MNFDNKATEGIAHLDVSPNLCRQVDFSSLTRCSRNWLPVLATITSESTDNGGDEDLVISDYWPGIADNVAFQTLLEIIIDLPIGFPINNIISLAFQTCSSHGVWQPSFSDYFERSASLFRPKTWSAPINTWSNLWLTKCCELKRLCSLANLSRFDSRILVAANGMSCLTISFHICTIMCAVASYVHYTISFKMCRHSCAKFVMGVQMPLIMLEFLSLLLMLRIQHIILVSGLCQFKRSLFIFLRNCLTTKNHVRRLITSIWYRPWSRKLLCFRKWPDGHFIFCRLLSFITAFIVPSCLPRWIQQSTEARPWFLWTLCAYLFLNDNL